MIRKKPNILVIQADQLTPCVLPAYASPPYGNRMLRTPHIDALAETGVVFENAYCNFPLCVPSRASMMTGRLAHNVAAWDNAAELPASIPTLAHYLRNEGYRTTLCGKMHFVGPDQMHGFEERITTDVYPSNFSWTPDWLRGERYRPTGINPRTIVESGVCVRSLQIDYDDEVEHAGVQKIHDLARYGGDDPFLLWVSFTHPHSPYVTTRKYWDLYDHDDIDMPVVPPIPVDELDAFSRWLHFGHGEDLLSIEDEHVRNARHAYYGMCSYVDDKVGRIMETLRATGLDDNTVVVLTSDHGEMLGERGMWYKQAFFEWSARVPLIVRFPGEFQSRRVPQLVSLVDLLPTFMDLATGGRAAEPASPLDGNSLCGLLSGQADGRDNTVISEYTGEGVVAPCRMIRRDDFKYIYTHGHPGMMFNLESDPHELQNLAGTAAAADVEARLLKDLLSGWDPDDIMARCIQSQKHRLFIQESTGGEPNWAFRFRHDDGERYIRNAGAADTKARARFPYVEPTPFKQ